MNRRQEGGSTRMMAWGCLIAVILLAGLAGSLAIIFLWDVNGPHG